MKKIKPLHVLKIGLGVDMLMHGLVRIPILTTFVDKTGGGFGTSLLPLALVRIFLFALPFVEAIIGLLIFFRGKTGRLGLIAGGLLMSILIFGSTSKQDWQAAGQQVVYLIAFTIAIYLHDKDGDLSKG